MKTPPALLRRIRHAAAALLLAGAATAHAQFPLGTWDCVLSEKQIGLAVLRFDADFTFTGMQIVRPGGTRLPAPDTNPRYVGGEPTRQGQEIVAVSTGTTNNVFVGATDMSGRWGYDDVGRVIGLLDQITTRYELVSKTNYVLVDTNLIAIVTNAFEAVTTTNAVSFRGSGVAGQRITIASYLQGGGRILYRGTPAIARPDQSGDLFATGQRGALPYVEFLTLTPDATFPNFYTVAGSGAGYSFNGVALISRTGRIALYSQSDRVPFLITVHSGMYNVTTRRGTIYGYDSDGKKYNYRVVHY